MPRARSANKAYTSSWANPKLPKSYRLIKTAFGILKIGCDDIQINRAGAENMSELIIETGPKFKGDGLSIYAAIQEDRDRSIIIKNVIFAYNILEAINQFEKDAGKHIWLPAADVNIHDCQLGLPRLADEDVPIIMLQRMNRANVLGNFSNLIQTIRKSA